MKTEGQKQSQAHERRLANAIGGKPTPASGAFATAKGDVRQDRDDKGQSHTTLLIEHKWTGKKQVTIRSDVLQKIEMEAILEGRIPCLGLHVDGLNYVVLTENDFLELRDELARLRSQL